MTAARTDHDAMPTGGPGDPAGHYAALGASPGATPDELVAAHRAAARRWHPDRNPDRNTTREMQRVNAAAEVLLNPARRADYDRSARRPPVVLSVVPGAADLPPTTVGRPVSTRVTVCSSEPLEVDELDDVVVSATTGPGWSARVTGSTDPAVVAIIEVTSPARVVGRVADTIVVRVAGASAVIQVNGRVTPVATSSTSGRTTPPWTTAQQPPPPPAAPPPPPRTPVRHTGGGWWDSAGPAWSGWATSLVWPSAIMSVLLVGNSTTGYVENGAIPAGIFATIPWLSGFVMAAGLVALAWATRLFTRGGWLLRILTAVFIAPAVFVAGIVALVAAVAVVVIAVTLFFIALSS